MVVDVAEVVVNVVVQVVVERWGMRGSSCSSSCRSAAKPRYDLGTNYIRASEGRKTPALTELYFTPPQ